MPAHIGKSLLHHNHVTDPSNFDPFPFLPILGPPCPRSLEIGMAIDRRRIQDRPLTAAQGLQHHDHRRDGP